MSKKNSYNKTIYRYYIYRYCIGIKDANKIDNKLMSGKISEIKKIGIEILDEITKKITEKDKKRWLCLLRRW